MGRLQSLVKPCLGPIVRRDQAVVRRAAAWRPPRWFRLWMVYATRGGDGGLWVGAGLMALGFGGRERWQAFNAAAIAAGLAILAFMTLKRVARRQRPAIQHAWAKLTAPDEHSFPSGHSLTAFAIGTAMLWNFPTFGWVLMFCAASVALSRIMLGLHYVSDVLMGSALGTFIGLLSVHLIAHV